MASRKTEGRKATKVCLAFSRSLITEKTSEADMKAVASNWSTSISLIATADEAVTVVRATDELQRAEKRAVAACAGFCYAGYADYV